MHRKSTLVGQGEHVRGVVLRILSPTELVAINLLISELDFPLIEQDQRVQVASRLILRRMGQHSIQQHTNMYVSEIAIQCSILVDLAKYAVSLHLMG